MTNSISSSIKIKEPQIIDQLFLPEEFKRLQSLFMEFKKNDLFYDGFCGRYIANTQDLEVMGELAESLTPLARKIFSSETLLPSYTLFAHYQGECPRLEAHKDDNACTYTLDYCIYQNEPWDIWVEGAPYRLEPNQALAFYGNDQLHWREEFPNPETNAVAMIFFHFVEPDHWYFTKGPDYLNEIIRNKKSAY